MPKLLTMNTCGPHPMPKDEEVLAYIALSNSFYPADAFLGTVAQSRQWYDRYAAALARPFSADIAAEDFSISDLRQGRSIAARRYRNLIKSGVAGVAVLYIHGGGFVLGGLESHADVCAGLCQLTGLDVVASTYRLAPEHVHPAQLDDVETAFNALSSDGTKLILCGDSAGASLIAGLGIRLQARGASQALGHVLIYPGLGGDPTQGSYLSNAHAPMLTSKECAYYFGVRTEGLTPLQRDNPELRPLLAADLSDMPPTLVVTADIDPLRDDGELYSKRLQALGVRVQYRNELELVHGYLRARHTSSRAAASFATIAEALQNMARGMF
jgi:acetyl esterase